MRRLLTAECMSARTDGQIGLLTQRLRQARSLARFIGRQQDDFDTLKSFLKAFPPEPHRATAVLAELTR